MSVRMTILGMGQVGASIGMALADKAGEIHRMGHDRDMLFSKEAKSKNAVDKIAVNLHAAVADADIVVLALPLSEVKEVLQHIAADLREDTVVLDTCPVRQVCEQWAAELLPPGRHYLGFTPILNPKVLHKFEAGVQGAQEDLFRGGRFAISSNARVPSAAIKLATDLCGYLDAEPLFCDLLEVDGYMAPVHILPQLLAAALTNATTTRVGWDDVRKFAGRPFAQTTSSIANADKPPALASAAMTNKANVLRVFDELLAELGAMRAEIESDALDSLEDRLANAAAKRDLWWSDRLSGDWERTRRPDVDEQDTLNLMKRAFGLRRRVKDKDAEEK